MAASAINPRHPNISDRPMPAKPIVHSSEFDFTGYRVHARGQCWTYYFDPTLSAAVFVCAFCGAVADSRSVQNIYTKHFDGCKRPYA